MSRIARTGESYLPNERNHVFRKTLHLLALRAELKKRDLDADLLEREQPLGDLVGHTGQSRAQPSIRYRVILERDLLLQLRAGKPLLVVRETARTGVDVRDPVDLATDLHVAVAANHESGDAENQRRLSGREDRT